MDERLHTAAELFPKVRVGADIGANHGLLACHLLETEKTQRMLVSDISASALSEARKNIERKGLTGRAILSVGDGFEALSETPDAAAILGMGGKTIIEILSSAPKEKLPPVLILSAHTDQEILRRSVYETSYLINEERLVKSGGRYYVVFRAVAIEGAQVPDERTLFLGPCLMTSSSRDYLQYLNRRVSAYRDHRSPEGQERYGWLKEEINRVRADSEKCT